MTSAAPRAVDQTCEADQFGAGRNGPGYVCARMMPDRVGQTRVTSNRPVTVVRSTPMRFALRVLAGLIAIGAGIYLLSYSGGTIDIGGQSGKSWFDIIDHGIGIYFIARGLWMCASAGVHDDAITRLDRLVELREWEVENTFDVDDDGAMPQPAE